MSAYFATRHKGAVDWARNRGIDAVFVEHFDVETVRPGDIVYGTLPVSEAAGVYERGGRYFHLSLRVPGDWRGRELTAGDMEAFGAELEEYEVRRV